MGKEALAFNDQFYKKEIASIDRVIEDDLVSYLGEYRFQVSAYDYRMGLQGNKLTDPNTGELMAQKAKKAIFQRQLKGLKSDREEAELTGLLRLEQKLLENPFGTAVWLSPKGLEEEGYGDYGFAYVGKRDKDGIALTAVRLNGSTLNQFNEVKRVLNIEGSEFKTAEDFLANPWVIKKPADNVKEIIKKQFDAKDNGAGDKLERAKNIFAGHFKDFVEIVKHGSEEAIKKARNVIENLVIEFIRNGEENTRENIVFLSNFRAPVLGAAMEMKEYNKQPEVVMGSCGASGKTESSNLSFLKSSYTSTSSLDSDEFGSLAFKCPVCGVVNVRPRGELLSACQHCNSSEVMCE